METSIFEGGISDFHKMVATVLKTHYKKQKAKIIHYQNHKNLSMKHSKTELNNKAFEIDLKNAEFNEFKDIFTSELN